MHTERLRALEATIAAGATGAIHFPEIYGSGRDELYVGDKVRLGREFMNLVRKGHFDHVADTGKKTAGRRFYLRTC